MRFVRSVHGLGRPFRASVVFGVVTQGVALGYGRMPRWGGVKVVSWVGEGRSDAGDFDFPGD